ncbi:MAG: hypothetical protein VKM97_05375 [Cyanobacteriota bacterium]|nr:hypothetical protein [Cyanobacteriota bacterium]
MRFWAPAIDPAHPLECTQPERYVLKHLGHGSYLAIAADGISIQEVSSSGEAHGFHTHEAALRAANELNHEGRGPIDVVKDD